MTINWIKIDEETYDEALSVVPPILKHNGGGFLMGEAISHRTCEVTGKFKPTFRAYVFRVNGYFKSEQPVTIPEFERMP